MADQSAQFEKDFGYLMPFLENVAAAAGGLADPKARQELARLVEGEKERWTRIRQLLSGEASGSQNSQAPVTEGRAAQPSDSAAPGQEGAARVTFEYSVGSLRPLDATDT